MKISRLWIYPVKSLGPVALDSAQVTPRGLAGDRRWMIVDAEGRFVTRRELPALARIALSMGPGGGYRLCASEGRAALPAGIVEGAAMPVTIWRDTVPALVVENEASVLISDVAGRALRLAYMPEETHRQIDPAFARNGEGVSFADGFPLLVVTEASLAALNAALERPVPVERFRASIVLSGEDVVPWAEAGWTSVDAGEVRLRFTKPCSRCIVITQHPDTGEREEGNAVPMALRRMGKFNAEGALFGMNAVPEMLGRIAVGDEVRAIAA